MYCTVVPYLYDHQASPIIGKSGRMCHRYLKLRSDREGMQPRSGARVQYSSVIKLIIQCTAVRQRAKRQQRRGKLTGPTLSLFSLPPPRTIYTASALLCSTLQQSTTVVHGCCRGSGKRVQ